MLLVTAPAAVEFQLDPELKIQLDELTVNYRKGDARGDRRTAPRGNVTKDVSTPRKPTLEEPGPS